MKELFIRNQKIDNKSEPFIEEKYDGAKNDDMFDTLLCNKDI